MSTGRATRDSDDRPPRVRVPPRRAESRERGYDVHTGRVRDRRGQRPDLRRFTYDTQTVAQPLDRGAGDEDRAFHRVCHRARRERPRDRRQQAVDRLGLGGTDVREHERSRAVGVLRHARRDTRLSEQGCLLVAGDAADRYAQARSVRGNRDAEPPTRRPHLRQARTRHVEQLAELVRPVAGTDVVEHRAARVRRIGRVDAPIGSAGQLPEQPGVDGAEREVVVDGHAARMQQPRELRCREVRIEHEPRGAADHRLVPGRAQLIAAFGGTAVLPHDRARPRLAGAPIPDHDGLALVRDADRRDRLAAIVHLPYDLTERLGRRSPDVLRVVLDPARSREVLRKLAVRMRTRLAVVADGEGAHPRCSGVDGNHAAHACSPRARATSSSANVVARSLVRNSIHRGWALRDEIRSRRPRATSRMATWTRPSCDVYTRRRGRRVKNPVENRKSSMFVSTAKSYVRAASRRCSRTSRETQPRVQATIGSFGPSRACRRISTRRSRLDTRTRVRSGVDVVSGMRSGSGGTSALGWSGVGWSIGATSGARTRGRIEQSRRRQRCESGC